MNFNEYQKGALRTAPEVIDKLAIAVLALGVAGEGGEVSEIIKKHVGHGHALDRDKLIKEMGDVLWYLATLAGVLDIKLSVVARKNLAKLQARYPDGFSHEASQNRKEEP